MRALTGNAALFHSFPRPKGSSLREMAESILRSVLSGGLLLLPERIEFPQEETADGTILAPVTIWQRRFCLTAIDAAELPAHSRTFGPWSIEFSFSAARILGAMPVVYVPWSKEDRSDAISSFGVFLVHRLKEMQVVMDDLWRLEQSASWDSLASKFTDDRAEFSQLLGAVQALSGLFYHVSRDDQDPLLYFRQREWRILSHVIQSSPRVSYRPLHAGEIEELVQLSPFFSKRMDTPDGPSTFAHEAVMFEAVDGRPIRDLIAGVHVPKEDVDVAKRIVRDFCDEELVRGY